jgi:ATP-dependent exoDNAse (exonuclease V) beta subunit
MTIHKSKGLEFGTVMVFLHDLKKPRNTKDWKWIEPMANHDLGVMSLRVSALKSTRFQGLAEEEEHLSMLDQLNSWYVAFTRAKERLEIYSRAPSRESILLHIMQWPEWSEEEHVLCIE